MNSVKVDRKLNSLTIRFTARSRAELVKVVADIKAATGELEPDLTCLADFRGIWELIPENGDLFEKAQRYLLRVGVGKVVRVLNPGQFNTPAHRRLEALPTGYRYSYATSLEEGEQILDDFRQELLRGTRHTRPGKGQFKYVDRSGWEQDTSATDFDSAFRRLKKLREKGRKQAIIVDAGFKPRV